MIQGKGYIECIFPCDCSDSHFMRFRYWPADRDLIAEGFLSIEGDFRQSLCRRLASAWSLIKSGHAETSVEMVVHEADAKELAAMLTEYADECAKPDPRDPRNS